MNTHAQLPLGVGIIGAGKISGAYTETIRNLAGLELISVADADPARAQALASAEGVVAQTVAELLANPRVDVVVNLTIPAAHAQIAQQAIAAGKHVYNEKPLTTDRESAQQIIAAAQAASVVVGGAPDTILGTGTQTAKALIAAGKIGTPTSATISMQGPGHERWHPDPDFYYQPGGGPVLDMGPYYLSALVALLGPIESVQADSLRPQHVRTIGSGPRAGQEVPVAIDTHLTGTLRHQSGVLTTFTMSFDVAKSTQVPIEIHGSAGSLQVPDPNRFEGDVKLFQAQPAGAQPAPEWETIPPRAGYTHASRGVGVLDLLAGEQSSGSVSAELAYHVLDVMLAIHEAADAGARVQVLSTCDAGQLIPLAPPPGGIAG